MKLTKAARKLKADQRLCKRCSGSGIWGVEKDQVCFRCNGSGVEHSPSFISEVRQTEVGK